MICTNCGVQLPEDAKFCVNCGAKAEAAGNADTAQEETAAAVDVAEAEAEAVSNAEGSETAQAQEQQAVTSDMPQAGPVQPEARPEPEKQPAETAAAQPSPQAGPAQTQYQQAPKQPVPQADEPARTIIIEKTGPLSFWKFLGILFLTSIPVVGFIMILVWSFVNSFNKNTRNYARAVFVLGLIYTVALIAVIIANLGHISEFVGTVREVVDSLGYTFEFGW